MIPASQLTEDMRHKWSQAIDRYVNTDGTVNWLLVYQDVGITDDASLRDALVAILFLNPEVATAVNRTLMQLALGPEHSPTHLPVLEPPPISEFAWRHGDLECVKCPGSEMTSPFHTEPTVQVPACKCAGRAEKWNHCIKYRGNLKSPPSPEAVLGDEKVQDIKAMCQELVQSWFPAES